MSGPVEKGYSDVLSTFNRELRVFTRPRVDVIVSGYDYVRKLLFRIIGCLYHGNALSLR